MARSSAFQEFLAGVNAPVTLTRDSLDEIPDIGALYELNSEERVEAERVLIAKLAENDGGAKAATSVARRRFQTSQASNVRPRPGHRPATSTRTPFRG